MASRLNAEITPSEREETVETASDVQENVPPSEPDASPHSQENRSNEQSSGQAATPCEKRKVVLVIAGQSGSGKSTALNNLFGTDFKSIYSVDSVTTSVGLRRTEGTEGDLIIVDTPGFGATDLPTAKIKKELDKSIGHLDCVLIYCYSISPGSRQNVAEELVVKNLDKVLGKNIWKKCVVLFTFSDRVRAQECSTKEEREKYKEFLRSHAGKFSGMLKKKCGKHVPTVKTIYDIDLDQEVTEHIVAVPVGEKLKKKKEKHELVPDIEDCNWLDISLFEIIRKADYKNRMVYLDHMTNKKWRIAGAAASGVAVGLVVGLASGIVAGAATFGALSIPIGIAVGSAVGGAVATAGGLSVEIGRDRMSKKQMEKLRKLENAPLIQKNPAEPSPQANSPDEQVAEPTPSAGPQTSTPHPIPTSHIQEIKSDTGISSSPPAPEVSRECPDSKSYSYEHTARDSTSEDH